MQKDLQGIKDFFLKTEARIWPSLSYACPVHSTAVRCRGLYWPWRPLAADSGEGGRGEWRSECGRGFSRRTHGLTVGQRAATGATFAGINEFIFNESHCQWSIRPTAESNITTSEPRWKDLTRTECGRGVSRRTHGLASSSSYC